ncbi:MAG: hypothetical protein ACI9SJ_000474 [Flavobacteriaceae bacterium]|jgi:hypothetical protein|uniref:hypothetical protein n=1 Tax=Candidatus Marifrigoribacter sp. Uisw_064 TaxID=3230970 RepID=UPI003AED4F35
MFKKIDKVLAAFGSVKAMERLHVDTFTEEKMENVDGDKIAESKEGQIYVGVSDINGYLFLETILFSGINIKTFNGGTLSFIGGAKDFELKSDTQEIVAEFSTISNRFMSQVSFDISEEEIEKLRNGDFQQIRFSFKKKSITMNRITA